MEKYDKSKDLYPEIGLCDKHCKKCIHSCYLNGSMYSCDYILNTGHRRPCPAGKGCTEYKEIAKKKTVKRLRVLPKVERVCNMCGCTFEGTNLKRFCDPCYAIRSSKHCNRRVVDWTGICKYCGKKFVKTNGKEVYCQQCKNEYSLWVLRRKTK